MVEVVVEVEVMVEVKVSVATVVVVVVVEMAVLVIVLEAEPCDRHRDFDNDFNAFRLRGLQAPQLDASGGVAAWARIIALLWGLAGEQATELSLMEDQLTVKAVPCTARIQDFGELTRALWSILSEMQTPAHPSLHCTESLRRMVVQ